jgi:predicted small secreted protein
MRRLAATNPESSTIGAPLESARQPLSLPQRRLMVTKILSASILAVALALAGCNTVEGIGKDFKALGSKLERTASNEKKY